MIPGHPNCKAYWPMSDTADLSGNAKTLTNVGSATFTKVTGLMGISANLPDSAANKYFTAGAANNEFMSPEITIFVRFKMLEITRADNTKPFFCISRVPFSLPHYFIVMYVNKGVSAPNPITLMCQNSDGTYSAIIRPASFSTNEIGSVAGTYRAGNIADGVRLFKNGVVVGTAASKAGLYTGSGSDCAGLALGNIRNFVDVSAMPSIEMDDVIVYNYAMADSDVLRLHYGLHPLGRS